MSISGLYINIPASGAGAVFGSGVGLGWSVVVVFWGVGRRRCIVKRY